MSAATGPAPDKGIRGKAFPRPAEPLPLRKSSSGTRLVGSGKTGPWATTSESATAAKALPVPLPGARLPPCNPASPGSSGQRQPTVCQKGRLPVTRHQHIHGDQHRPVSQRHARDNHQRPRILAQFSGGNTVRERSYARPPTKNIELNRNSDATRHQSHDQEVEPAPRRIFGARIDRGDRFRPAALSAIREEADLVRTIELVWGGRPRPPPLTFVEY